MTIEQYSIGYDEGYQKGWNDAMDEKPAQQQEACPFPCGWKNLFLIIVSDGAFLARSLVENEPITDYQRASVMRMIDYAKTMASHGMHTSPPAQRKPLTDEMVVAAARMLSDRQAAACNVDCGDMWKLHGNDFIEDARAALEAAHSIKEKT